MSASPAPTDRDFSIVPGLKQFVITTRNNWVWRIHSHDDDAGKPYASIYFSNAAGSRWDFKGQSSGAAVVAVDGVLCVGATFTGALIEVFGKRWPSILPSRGASPASFLNQRVLTNDDITKKYATRLRLPAGLKIFDLTKAGALSSIGVDGELTTTKDYATTQEWAKWFFQCRDIDGLKYSSRPGGADLINYVLFNRSGLQEALEGNAGKTRPLIRWSARLVEACQALNVIVLSKPTPPGP